MIKDKNLSWKAKGLMSYLLSLPDDWVVHKSELCNNSKDGRDATRAAFDELESSGYIVSIEIRDVNTGQFMGFNYMVYAISLKSPITENPSSVNLISDNLMSEKPSIQRTNNTKNLNTTKDNGLFDLFWSVYPKKEAKAKALIAWNKAKIDDETAQRIIKAVENRRKTEQWLKENGQFIPLPATYLNQARWNDVVGITPIEKKEVISVDVLDYFNTRIPDEKYGKDFKG